MFDEKLVVPNTKLPAGLLFELQITCEGGIFQKPYRTNTTQERDALRDTLAKLVRDGLLKPARPDVWTNPGRIVPKKDGSWRLVCNYIALSMVTTPMITRCRAWRGSALVLLEPDYY